MKIVKYSPEWEACWNELVAKAPTGTFLHDRNFMDYHSHRFEDYSILAFDSRDRLIACLPANKSDRTIASHAGLTYGGWIVDNRRVTTTIMLRLWEESINYYKGIGCNCILYKAVPSIYHKYPAEDDLYAIYRCGGSICSSQISSTINLQNPIQFDSNARRNARYAIEKGVSVRETEDFEQFFNILSELLASKYNVLPVHSLDEITLLKSRFKNNIRLFGAYRQEEMIAGVLMFFTDTVAHAQYIAASPQGKEVKSLPLIFSHIIDFSTGRYRYFDFGTSNENGGLYLNEGLIRQKCGMGGRGIVYNTYRIPIL